MRRTFRATNSVLTSVSLLVCFSLTLLKMSYAAAEPSVKCLDYKAYSETLGSVEWMVDDAAVGMEKALWEQCHGAKLPTMAMEETDMNQALDSLVPAARAAMLELAEDRIGDIQFAANPDSGRVIDIQMRLLVPAGSPAEALDQILEYYWPYFVDAFGVLPEDTFESEVRESGPITAEVLIGSGDNQLGLEAPAIPSLTELILRRSYAGVPFPDNFVKVLIAEQASGLYRLERVSARYNAPPTECVPRLLSDDELAKAVFEAFGPEALQTAHSKSISIVAADGESHYSQAVGVLEDSSQKVEATPIPAYFDVCTGALVTIIAPQNLNGSVSVLTNVPFEDYDIVGKVCHRLPYVNISDRWKFDIEWYIANPSYFLGETGYHGTFSIPSYEDWDWWTDLRGTWIKDVSYTCQEDDRDPNEVFDLTFPVPANSSNVCLEWPDPSLYPYCGGRRADRVFQLNFAHAFAEQVGYWSYALPNIEFQLTDRGQSPCGPNIGGQFQWDMDEETALLILCNEKSDYGETGSSNSIEQAYRRSAFHEYSHSLSCSANPSGCMSSGCTPDPLNGQYCYRREIEEGFARYGAAATSGLEDLKGYCSLPQTADDDSCLFPPNYDNRYWGKVLLTLFTEINVCIGNYAYAFILRAMADNGSGSLFIAETAADCQTENVDSCPSSGLYSRLLLWDQSTYNVSWEHATEVSEAFHRRTADANPHVTGVQSFPYKDNATNMWTHGRMLAVEKRSNLGPVQNNAMYGTDSSSPTITHSKLALEYKTDGMTQGDIDTFTLFARAGERYLVETHNGGSLVADTEIDIRDKYGVGPVNMCQLGGLSTSVCLDDDSGEGLYSKLEFVPTSTGWYRLFVRPSSPNDVGISKVYQVRYTLVDDDYGDIQTRANPIAVALPSVSSGNIGTISAPSGRTPDLDWVYFYYPGKWDSSDLAFMFCHFGSNAISWKVYDASGNSFGPEWTSDVCGTELPVTYSFSTPGFYFIRFKSVSPTSSASYSFSVRRPVCTSPHANDCTDLDYEDDSCGTGPVHECNALDMDAIETGVTPYWMLRAGLERAGDADWYKFHANKGDIWTIETSSLTPGATNRIEVRKDNAFFGGTGSSQHLVAFADSKSYPTTETSLVFVAPAEGTYYVVITNPGTWNGYQEYSVVWRHNGTYTNYQTLP